MLHQDPTAHLSAARAAKRPMASQRRLAPTGRWPLQPQLKGRERQRRPAGRVRWPRCGRAAPVAGLRRNGNNAGWTINPSRDAREQEDASCATLKMQLALCVPLPQGMQPSMTRQCKPARQLASQPTSRPCGRCEEARGRHTAEAVPSLGHHRALRPRLLAPPRGSGDKGRRGGQGQPRLQQLQRHGCAVADHDVRLQPQHLREFVQAGVRAESAAHWVTESWSLVSSTVNNS